MSSTYPISIEIVSLEHKGGTKAYHLYRMSTKSGASLVAFRWGKVGTFGEVQTHKFDTIGSAEEAFDKKLAAKMRGGYSPSTRHDPKPSTAPSFEDLRDAIGRPMLTRLGPTNLKHIDPNIDTTGMKEPDPPRLDENGRLHPGTEAKKRREEEERVRKAAAEIAAREEQERQEAYKDNPLFGAF